MKQGKIRLTIKSKLTPATSVEVACSWNKDNLR